MGIHFKEEVDINDGSSVLIDKEVKLDNREEAVKNYVKVLKMKELVDEEQEIVNKGLLIVKRMFNIIFKRGDKINLSLVFYMFMCSVGVHNDNLFITLLWSALIVSELGRRNALNYIKSCLTYEKEKQELEAMSLLENIKNVSSTNNIEMYFKTK